VPKLITMQSLEGSESDTMKTQGGFTLTELLVVIAIGAILAAVAVPNLSGLVADNRLTAATNDLIAQLSLARSEAIKRNESVVLCRSTNSTSEAPTCDGDTAQTWEDGWIVFVNMDGNTPPTYDPVNTDILLRVQEPMTGVMQLRSGVVNDTHFEYAPDGTSNMVGISNFAVCDDRGTAEGRQIQLGILGRPELLKDSSGTPTNPTSCTNPD